MANLPFGMKLEEGAPMSELTRRVISKVLATKKVMKDAAQNKDEVFNASNIKATAHDPSGSTGSHNLPMDNAEQYTKAQSEVPDNSTKHVKIVQTKEPVQEATMVDKLLGRQREAMKSKNAGLSSRTSSNLTSKKTVSEGVLDRIKRKQSGAQARELTDKLGKQLDKHTETMKNGGTDVYGMPYLKTSDGVRHETLNTRYNQAKYNIPSNYMKGKK